MPPARRRRWPKLLTVKQVAHLLNASERTVYRLVKAGHLSRPRRFAGAVRWFAADVKVFLYRLRRGDFEAAGEPARNRQKGSNH